MAFLALKYHWVISDYHWVISDACQKLLNVAFGGPQKLFVDLSKKNPVTLKGLLKSPLKNWSDFFLAILGSLLRVNLIFERMTKIREIFKLTTLE